ncbi:chorismate-binding protein [Desulfocurvibacter africanus]|uniref:Aminodeoxychorismate synthase n=1 Tax=Desulfocurvibacter africanus subsp. africanus str. Walvis Bay TaxID=690850 RepID=F3YXN0_DESAF|nr:chorismate-binding protein [Desulfocurvibacter africanus]EGJ49474.1 Aminodeoxychorismate synthase [Desulfocurvibacter africanus subsp. africanus str. Walvis Bay]
MPCANCFELPDELALSFLEALGLAGGVDVLLSAKGRHVSFLAGLGPKDELVVRASTSREELERFIFADERPTVGFLGYEYGLRRLGLTLAKDSDFPLGHLKKYETYLVYEAECVCLMGQKLLDGRVAALLERAAEAAAKTAESPAARGSARKESARAEGLGRLVSASLDRQGYEAAVRQAQERIRDGDTYQLNLSIRFTAEAKGLDAYGLFLDLARRHPASYYGYFESGPFRVVSTSPERFMRVRDGQVLSQPIKGTKHLDARFGDREAAEAEQALRTSAKEDAELSMIVDLVRNDISAHCEHGSVHVENHKSVFRVDNLLQMHSDVTGRLKPGSTVLDLLLDAFPPGSVTGCPKKRSCEIIDSLEPHSRDVYCGTLLAIYGRRDMDSSVAIRTGFLDTGAGFFHFYAGSGIVMDSSPSCEYSETLAKAEKFLQLLGGGE